MEKQVEVNVERTAVGRKVSVIQMSVVKQCCRMCHWPLLLAPWSHLALNCEKRNRFFGIVERWKELLVCTG